MCYNIEIKELILKQLFFYKIAFQIVERNHNYETVR